MAELHRERYNDPSSPRLLAVHGITGHGRRFERLAGDWWSDRHVVSVDLRGHGSSLDAAPYGRSRRRTVTRRAPNLSLIHI